MNWNSARIGLLLLVLMMTGSISCENERTSPKLLDFLEGEWQVDENSDLHGKKAYPVTISLLGQDSSRIFISNFYQLDGEVEANLDDQEISLVEDQEVNMINTSYTIVSGSGRVSDNYKYIKWDYKVENGSGEVDDVTATYTKE
ncbi:MAG: hypothetical protein ACQER7_01050 [Bacteroidota bacterium]